MAVFIAVLRKPCQPTQDVALNEHAVVQRLRSTKTKCMVWWRGRRAAASMLPLRQWASDREALLTKGDSNAKTETDVVCSAYTRTLLQPKPMLITADAQSSSCGLPLQSVIVSPMMRRSSCGWSSACRNTCASRFLNCVHVTALAFCRRHGQKLENSTGMHRRVQAVQSCCTPWAGRMRPALVPSQARAATGPATPTGSAPAQRPRRCCPSACEDAGTQRLQRQERT